MRKFLTPILIVLVTGYSSVVIIDEGTRGIMLRFSKKYIVMQIIKWFCL